LGGAPEAPDSTAETMQGSMRIHDWIVESRAYFFGHPKDVTPVCASDFLNIAGLQSQSYQRNATLGPRGIKGPRRDLSDHRRSGIDARKTVRQARYLRRQHPAPSCGGSCDRAAVFVIGPDEESKATPTYPMSIGRTVDEMPRLLDSTQRTAKQAVASSDDPAKQNFPNVWKTMKPSSRIVAQPQD
jgi:thioredoxin-dependent peroxiredoxin